MDSQVNNTQKIIVYRSVQEQKADEFWQAHPEAGYVVLGIFVLFFLFVFGSIVFGNIQMMKNFKPPSWKK